MIRVKIHKDLKNLDKLEESVSRKIGFAVSDAAIALQEDIRHNWSPKSPSSEGEPPAIDTGNLDKSIFIDNTGRGIGGKFASDKDAIQISVRIDTSKGSSYHGRGAYEGFLEDGTTKMAPRPFVQPAVERLEAVYSKFFADIFK